MNSSKPEFWDGRYGEGRMPWDFHGVPQALKDWLGRRVPKGRVLIPGSGSGYEVRAFVEAGWEVMAVDFSPAAVARASVVLGPLSDRVLLGDFFAYDFGERRFDLIYERTFLCSLPPEEWPKYAKRIKELLTDKGMLIGFFLYGAEDDPPPYPLTETQAQGLFREDFTRVADEAVSDSLPLFAGRERWQAWQRRRLSFVI